MYLLDTNVLCEPTRHQASEPVTQWLLSQTSVKVSAISLMEIEYGLSRLPKGEKRDRLTKWVEGVLASPAIEIVSVDAAVARSAGRLKRLAEAGRRPRPNADLIIAACAQVTGSVVATRNTADFEGLGVPLLNPFV
ncbi:MAG: type II toxin-antitoxin system VapC family toxin [Myxococcales bacterium]|nr:type II toxin-antitoxin system VapC family toxin [Myxococcales bacterium]